MRCQYRTYAATNVGAQYDPSSDNWLPITNYGAPALRYGHSAVWTGDRMLVWGGFSGSALLDTGGQYEPVHDEWLPMTATNAPAAREGAAAIWTGTHMIVWGGQIRQPPWYLGDGGLYDPHADTWQSITMSDAPVPRRSYSTVWTGDLMVVWGGRGIELLPTGLENLLKSGGAYTPRTDSWIPLPRDDAPLGREGASAVWTGREMIVWGGGIEVASLGSGGRYLPGNLIDADRDGFRICDGDCDDGDPAIHPGAADVCDGKDDDCDGMIPESEQDADGDGFRRCENDCNDSDATISPVAVELPGNGVDENCDGVKACDPVGSWSSHGQFVRCVAAKCGRMVRLGILAQSQCEALVSRAAQSDAGRRRRAPNRPSEP